MSLNHLMVMLASTKMYLWFLSIRWFITYTQSEVIQSLHIHTYFLRYLLSDRYGNLFSKVVMDSLLISRKLICILIFLSILIGLLVFGSSETLS